MRVMDQNKIFSGPVSFLKSAPRLEFLPEPSVPEIAFAGRSNVGKSSLINALVNRKDLARASNTPGRTQELNFFDVGDPPLFRIVDMPGYGYAKAPVATVKKWRFLVNDYLRGRTSLKRTFLLIDSRHGIKDVDREIMEMLDGAAVSYRIVLTKTDKIKASELAAVQADTASKLRKHVAAFPELSVTSAEKRGGIEDLRAAVLEAIAT
jgi:GTP-binding protein